MAKKKQHEQLKVFRKTIGWTQQHAANWLGHSVISYNAWERGRVPIPKPVMMLMQNRMEHPEWYVEKGMV